MSKSTSRTVRRRDLLAGTAMLLFSATTVRAASIVGQLPWTPNAGDPPSKIKLGPWEFFTGEEGRTMEALADRIIPADSETPGGKDSGCAVFVDRQLAGPYGRQEGLYVRPPFQAGACGEIRQRVAAALGSLAWAFSVALCQRRITMAVTPLSPAASCRRRDAVNDKRVASPTTAARTRHFSPSSIAGRTSRSFHVSQ